MKDTIIKTIPIITKIISIIIFLSLQPPCISIILLINAQVAEGNNDYFSSDKEYKVIVDKIETIDDIFGYFLILFLIIHLLFIIYYLLFIRKEKIKQFLLKLFFLFIGSLSLFGLNTWVDAYAYIYITDPLYKQIDLDRNFNLTDYSNIFGFIVGLISVIITFTLVIKIMITLIKKLINQLKRRETSL